MADLAVDDDSDFGRRAKPARGGRPPERGPLSTIAPFVLRYWRELCLALAFLALSTIALLSVPAVLGDFLQRGFIERNAANVQGSALLILAIAAVLALASGARMYFIARLGERIVSDLRRAVFSHLLSLDVSFYDSHRVGELTSRLGSDVATIRGSIGTTLTAAVRALITICGALLMMLRVDVGLALIVMIGGPLALGPVLLLSRRMRRMSRAAQDAVAEMSAMATEMLGANRVVKAFTQEAEQTRRYAARSEDSLAAESHRLLGRAAIVASVTMIATGALVGVATLGANAVLEERISVGQLAQFLIYTLMAAGALTTLSEIMGSLSNLAGSTERLAEILNQRPAVSAHRQAVALPRHIRGRVRVEGVTFRYSRGAEPALENVSFSVKPGQTVALVGASGAGKSTIFALLQRFYDVDSGSIEIDGIDLREADPVEVRARIASVEQDPTIFAGTIADNIRFGRASATDAQVRRAAALSLVTEFSDSLSAGLDTIVGERGVRLSGGQRQRLAIARAILKDAPILLLDEATSALDTANERLVQAALAPLRGHRTTLVIAHRLSTVRNADKIIVLEKGRIVSRGTHDALMVRGGIYERLVRMQFAEPDEPIQVAAGPGDQGMIGLSH